MNKDKLLKKLIILSLVLLPGLPMTAENLPVEGLLPSHTLPILYINTEGRVPIDQKETYINAEWWLDAGKTSTRKIVIL